MTYSEPAPTYSDLSITLTAYDRRVQITIPLDSDVYELLEAFRAAAVGLTYMPKSIDEAILDAAEHIREQQFLDARDAERAAL